MSLKIFYFNDEDFDFLISAEPCNANLEKVFQVLPLKKIKKLFSPIHLRKVKYIIYTSTITSLENAL